MKVMRIAESFEQYDSKPQTTDKAFKRGADMKEGINGQLEIDTTYEQGEAVCSRSEIHYRSNKR